MQKFLMAIVLGLSGTSVSAQESPFQIAPLFTDHMVLQQKTAAPTWGRGTPGTKVTVHGSWGKESSTVVGPDSSWSLTLRTPSAGGPYDITVEHADTTLTLKDVLIGEVWLCSGQSNMEMPLEGWPPDTILQGSEEISNSSNSAIRLFSVRRAYSPTPASECSGNWEVCTPESSPTFSAVGYFFGRELQKTLHVPIGLINVSWGGTRVESWISARYLSQISSFDSVVQSIRANEGSMFLFRQWLRQFPVIDMKNRKGSSRWQNLAFGDAECGARLYPDSAWGTMRLPTLWERTNVGEFDGTVWFRKTITIPAGWMHKDLIVELGPIDDMDATYVDGRMIGSHETAGLWKLDRIYTVPADLVDSTMITIAVRVIDNGGGGGIYGSEKSMTIHPVGSEEKVSLAGDWKFLPVADYRGDRFYVLGSKGELFFKRPDVPIDFTGYSPTALYNGMIHPLIPYSIAGVIWYQGEANVDAPALYKRLFPLLIENWRNDFGIKTLPFSFVQIAPFDYGTDSRSQYLREAQMTALSLKNAGMAVTLDIGNPANIHPANKQEVGRRLSLWALARVYGRPLEFSGPVYKAIRLFKNRIGLTFAHASKGLVLTGGPRGSGFEIAGEDRIFRSADVAVRGKMLIVSNPKVIRPQSVRYAFDNTAQATLFNTDGLPAPSFRTDDWDH